MIVIVGGGAAGLFCAAHIKNEKVLILEKNTRLGLKLLISGSGQCNLTHSGEWNDFSLHYGHRDKFVKNALKAYGNKEVMDFFEAQNVPLTVREDGKVFPKSMRSKDVLEGLLQKIRKNGNVVIETNQRVERIRQSINGFEIEVGGKLIHANAVVLASGGYTYPQLGTTGDGYRLASELGHSIVPPRPALASVKVSDSRVRALQGLVVSNMIFTLEKKHGQQLMMCGDVLVTHFGLSGPGILDNSRFINEGDYIKLNFTKSFSKELDAFILKEIDQHGKNPVSYLLNQLGLPDRVKQFVLEALSIEASQKLAVITKVQRKQLVETLCAYPVKVDGLAELSDAMATAGGISIDEFSSKTMMSKIVPEFYAVGEVLDVDGDTGGYNLQWAFSSAKAAANAIEKKVRENKYAK